MAILITNMEMPKKGEYKHIRIYDNGVVTIEANRMEYSIARAESVSEKEATRLQMLRTIEECLADE